MRNGLVYWNPIGYHYAMRILYGKSFYSRYELIAKLLPDQAEVVDVCCGDCYLYNFLKDKKINYLGLDINGLFVNQAVKRGISARVFNVADSIVPKADYIVIQGSLYQFIPGHRFIIDKLISSARKAIIISEPVVNIAMSKSKAVSLVASMATCVDGKYFLERFDKKDLLDLFAAYKISLIQEISGGRDIVGVFKINN